MLIQILMPTYSVSVIQDGNIVGEDKSESIDHVSCSGFDIWAGHYLLNFLLRQSESTCGRIE